VSLIAQALFSSDAHVSGVGQIAARLFDAPVGRSRAGECPRAHTHTNMLCMQNFCARVEQLHTELMCASNDLSANPHMSYHDPLQMMQQSQIGEQ
jgi:hypothetical protein